MHNPYTIGEMPQKVPTRWSQGVSFAQNIFGYPSFIDFGGDFRVAYGQWEPSSYGEYLFVDSENPADFSQVKYYHSTLIRNLIKLKGTAKLTAQDEQVCLKDNKYILFEILQNQTRKGRTSSCWPSKPDLAIWLARPAGACTALPCLIF